MSNGNAILLIIALTQRENWKQANFWRVGNLTALRVVLCFLIGVGLNLFAVGAINLTRLTNLFPSYEKLMNGIMSGGLAFQIISLVFLLPVTEEIIFRGITFARLKQMVKLPAAVIVQALLFGLIHFNILQGLYACVLGVVACVSLILLDSIWAAIVIHIAYNFMSVALVNVLGDKDLSVAALVIMAAAGAGVSAAGLLYMLRKRKESVSETI